VKYWGKKPVQIPANPSISITLSHAYTETTILFGPSGEMNLEFFFEGRRKPDFEQKVRNYLLARRAQLPFLGRLSLKISSHNTFPHSTGIASSASGMSALCLCLASMEQHFTGKPETGDEFFQHASRFSRLASGSACRSVYGGYTVWGKHKLIAGSSNEYAVPVPVQVHPALRDMGDAILVVSSREKSVSSRAGHSLMDDHPYAPARFSMANRNIASLIRCLEDGDTHEFVKTTENEALNLHALMMSSDQSYLLIEPNTVSIVQSIRRYRLETGIPVCFTLDAGPNVHLIYPLAERENVVHFIENELLKYCEHGQYIDDGIGNGPVQLKKI
jgi:diphosphomevalonate decarboxylase